MTRGGFAACLVAALAWVGGSVVRADDDPGKAVLARVGVGVIYATNGDPAAAGEKAKPLGKDLAKRLRKDERLRFKEYRALGEDEQPLFRSYENWAQPLKPSDEVLVRFEARRRPTRQATSLDLELWLGRKKILRSDVTLEGGRPLYVLGPEWRGGRLIIAVFLAEPREQR